MQIDRRMLERLTTLNDAQLEAVIKKVASQAGIDPAQLGLNTESIQNLRRAMSDVSPEDLQKFQQIYDAYRRGSNKS